LILEIEILAESIPCVSSLPWKIKRKEIENQEKIQSKAKMEISEEGRDLWEGLTNQQ